MATKTSSKGFKKGDQVFELMNWTQQLHDELETEEYYLRPVTVECAGKQIHCTFNGSGEFIKARHWTDERLFATIEDAVEYVLNNSDAIERKRRTLHCLRSNQSVLLPQYRQHGLDVTAQIEATVPKTIVWAGDAYRLNRETARIVLEKEWS